MVTRRLFSREFELKPVSTEPAAAHTAIVCIGSFCRPTKLGDGGL